MKKHYFLPVFFVLFTNYTLFAQTACPTLETNLLALRSNTNTNYCYAITTDFGTGHWYKDVTDAVTADNTGTVIVDGNHNRWKRIYTGAVHVGWWGAVANDTSSTNVLNNQTAIQNCFNSVAAYQTVYFDPGTYEFSSISITTPNLTITGANANLVGTLEVNNSSAATVFNSTITGLIFTTSGDAIHLKNCRNLRITGNVFNNCNRTIYVEPYTNDTFTHTKHSTGIIEMKGNYFNSVNFCFYADRGAKPNANWETVNDCTFEGNVVTLCDTTAVFCKGIDGLKVLGNTIFTPSDMTRRGRKRNHLNISDTSDFVVVNNNNLFESGTESVLVNRCKDLTVTGNNFAWSGQSGKYSVIHVTDTISSMNLTVSGNIATGFSENFVKVDDNSSGNIAVTGNTIKYSDSFSDYFGGYDLSSFQHYIVYAKNVLNHIQEKNEANTIVNLTSTYINGRNTKFETWGPFSAEAYVADTATFTGTDTVRIAGLYDAALYPQTFSGTLLIEAKSVNTQYSRTATYLLLVNQSTSGTPDVVATISMAGLTDGLLTNDPSFRFSAGTNGLLAKPYGVTTGTFYFYIRSVGDLVVTSKR